MTSSRTVPAGRRDVVTYSFPQGAMTSSRTCSRRAGAATLSVLTPQQMHLLPQNDSRRQSKDSWFS